MRGGYLLPSTQRHAGGGGTSRPRLKGMYITTQDLHTWLSSCVFVYQLLSQRGTEWCMQLLCTEWHGMVYAAAVHSVARYGVGSLRAYRDTILRAETLLGSEGSSNLIA